jgi:hypothetical protein
MLDEFFEILSDCAGDENMYIDIQILNSANKIKAILLLFGKDVSEVDYYNIGFISRFSILSVDEL